MSQATEPLNPNFGSPEIEPELVQYKDQGSSAADSDKALRDAMKACERLRVSIWPEAWHDNAGRVLSPAYRLFRVMQVAGPGAARVVAEALPRRKRRAKITNPAHLAMMFTLSPEDEAQRKTCSDYASVLIVFDQRGVGPEDVAEAMSETTLEECLRAVRGARRAARATSKKTGEVTDGVDLPEKRPPEVETPALAACAVASPKDLPAPGRVMMLSLKGAAAVSPKPAAEPSAYSIEIRIAGLTDGPSIRVPLSDANVMRWRDRLEHATHRSEVDILLALERALRLPPVASKK